jgi:hypothetical protein
LIPRIHLYTGLLTFANVILYAVVGIAALFDRPRVAAPAVSEQSFLRAPGETDRETAERVVHLLGLSLAKPVHEFNIRHEPDRPLVLDFYHANGRHKVTVLDGRIRVERTRASIFRYLSTLHVTTAAFHSGDWRMQIWAWWNEFAMWCLLAMTASGVWMWCARRDAKGAARRIHRSGAVALIVLLAIYELSAVQMAHRTWVKLAVWTERVHRMRGVSFAPLAGAGLLLMAATGLWLWWALPRERRSGTWLLGAGCAVAAGLAVWMRLQ